VERFVKLRDLQGGDCFINIRQIRAICASDSPRRGGSNIIFDSGSSLEVQESPERVICRCQNAGQARAMETAY
jgi:hypothetical protein